MSSQLSVVSGQSSWLVVSRQPLVVRTKLSVVTTHYSLHHMLPIVTAMQLSFALMFTPFWLPPTVNLPDML